VTGSSKNRIFQPLSRLWIPVFHQVTIDVEGDGGAGMAKLILDVFDILSLGD
jgi:hypothetical protein